MRRSVILFVILLLAIPLISSEYGNSGLFHLFYANSIGTGNYILTLGLDNLDREKQDIDINDFYLSLGYGLSNKVEIGARLNFWRRVDPDNLNDTYYNGTPYAHSPFYEGLGYADLGIKFSISKNFAIRGFVEMPLSSKDTATTTTKSAFGGNLILSTNQTKKGIFTLNVGYKHNGKIDKTEYVNFMNSNLSTFVTPAGSEIISDEILAGAGGKLRIANRVYTIGELYYTGYLNSDTEQKNNLDLAIGFQFLLNEKVKVNIAYKKNLLFNDGLPSTQGGAISIVYSTIPEEIKKKVVEKKEEPKPVIKKEVKKEVVKPVITPLIFKDTYFAFDSYELTDEAKSILLKEVEKLKERKDVKIIIEGHTCNIGTNAYNLALGEKRAQAVKDFMVSNGIDPSRIDIISYGEERPAFDNSTEETRRFNRRAHIKKKNG